MKTYYAYVPRWCVEVEAKNEQEALRLAGEIWDDHADQDPEFNQIKLHERQRFECVRCNFEVSSGPEDKTPLTCWWCGDDMTLKTNNIK